MTERPRVELVEERIAKFFGEKGELLASGFLSVVEARGVCELAPRDDRGILVIEDGVCARVEIEGFGSFPPQLVLPACCVLMEGDRICSERKWRIPLHKRIGGEGDPRALSGG